MGDDYLWAVKNGDMDAVRKTSEEPGFDINQELLNGRAAVHYAADYGQAEVIEYLASKGANINKPDKHGITPLLAAVFEGHVECVKLLLDKGAVKTGKGPAGNSYYDCAETDEIRALLK